MRRSIWFLFVPVFSPKGDGVSYRVGAFTWAFAFYWVGEWCWEIPCNCKCYCYDLNFKSLNAFTDISFLLPTSVLDIAFSVGMGTGCVSKWFWLVLCCETCWYTTFFWFFNSSVPWELASGYWSMVELPLLWRCKVETGWRFVPEVFSDWFDS